jgi:hypothetical protein
MVSREGPLPIAAQDECTMSNGGRQVLCHGCKEWKHWKQVTFKGAQEYEPRPAEMTLECCKCYHRRIGSPDVSLQDVERLYKQMYNEGKGKDQVRVKQWQSVQRAVASSASDSALPAGGTRAEQRKEFKRMFDILAEDAKAYNERVDTESVQHILDQRAAEVDLKLRDQYMGINDIQWNGETCRLINWSSATKVAAKSEQKLSILVHGKVHTHGLCLEHDCGAHNLCVISRHASEGLAVQWPKAIVFAVGGQYRGPNDNRGKQKFFNGVHLYGLIAASKHWDGWASLHWERLCLLFKGDHPGQMLDLFKGDSFMFHILIVSIQPVLL